MRLGSDCSCGSFHRPRNFQNTDLLFRETLQVTDLSLGPLTSHDFLLRHFDSFFNGAGFYHSNSDVQRCRKMKNLLRSEKRHSRLNP